MVSQNSIISNGAKFSFSGSNFKSPPHPRRRQVIVGICVEDKLNETRSDKEPIDLLNNDRFVGDTRHLMILVTVMVTKQVIRQALTV